MESIANPLRELTSAFVWRLIAIEQRACHCRSLVGHATSETSAAPGAAGTVAFPQLTRHFSQRTLTLPLELMGAELIEVLMASNTIVETLDVIEDF